MFYPIGGAPKVYAQRWLLGHLRGKPLVSKPRGVEDGCHTCDNPPCCNPAHLYVGTRKQNVADAVERRRLWQLKLTHCPANHPYDEANTYVSPRTGSRKCRACRALADRRRKEAQKLARVRRAA